MGSELKKKKFLSFRSLDGIGECWGKDMMMLGKNI